MDLTFQVSGYCSLQHRTLLPSPVTFTTGHCFHFGSVRGVISSVLYHHNKNLKWWTLKPPVHHSSWTVLQLHVTAQFHLENKEKYILKVWEDADPKDAKRREGERETPGPLAPFLYFFSSAWAHCMSIGLSRSAVCSTWGPHSSPQTLLCSILVGFSLACLLATPFPDFFFLFWLPNSSISSFFLELFLQ